MEGAILNTIWDKIVEVDTVAEVAANRSHKVLVSYDIAKKLHYEIKIYVDSCITAINVSIVLDTTKPMAIWGVPVYPISNLPKGTIEIVAVVKTLLYRPNSK